LPHPGDRGKLRLFLLMNNLLAGSALLLTALGSEPVCHWALACSAGLSYGHQRCEVVAQTVWEKSLPSVPHCPGGTAACEGFSYGCWVLGWPLGWSLTTTLRSACTGQVRCGRPVK